mmetsp:Transcript_26818/g.66749  ORF Transcript_26818/g.66749 Transcript_26818/m.66749 type:complete len:216 (+) Transcript_26818:3-650(+)
MLQRCGCVHKSVGQRSREHSFRSYRWTRRDLRPLCLAVAMRVLKHWASRRSTGSPSRGIQTTSTTGRYPNSNRRTIRLVCSRRAPSRLSFQPTGKSISRRSGRTSKGHWASTTSSVRWIWWRGRCLLRRPRRPGTPTSSSGHATCSSCSPGRCPSHKPSRYSQMECIATSSRSAAWFGTRSGSSSGGSGWWGPTGPHSRPSRYSPTAMSWCKGRQ